MEKKLKWCSVLRYDPIPALINSGNRAVKFFAEHDLLASKGQTPEILWDIPEAQKIVAKQQAIGAWKYPNGNKKIRSQENYDQIETFRNLGYLVEMYGFKKKSSAIRKAAEFLFHFQTKEGDIRGILGNQYTPYYTAAIAELLIKAGYEEDDRIENIFQWLRSIRQNDGGWAIPLRTVGRNLDVLSTQSRALQPDKTKPFSHMVTGIVLRAYAASKKYRKSEEADQAGKLLLSRFFNGDTYPDRKSPSLWLKFSFPFWFTDILSALDSLTMIGFSENEPQIERALHWFISHQNSNGLWKLHTLRNKKVDSDTWVSLAICRIFKRLYK